MFRWPWSRRRPDLQRLEALRRENERDRHEIAQDRREIEETKSLVEEAIRRTNERYIAVERETRRAIVEHSLIHDLDRALDRAGMDFGRALENLSIDLNGKGE